MMFDTKVIITLFSLLGATFGRPSPALNTTTTDIQEIFGNVQIANKFVSVVYTSVKEPVSIEKQCSVSTNVTSPHFVSLPFEGFCGETVGIVNSNGTLFNATVVGSDNAFSVEPELYELLNTKDFGVNVTVGFYRLEGAFSKAKATDETTTTTIVPKTTTSVKSFASTTPYVYAGSSTAATTVTTTTSRTTTAVPASTTESTTTEDATTIATTSALATAATSTTKSTTSVEPTTTESTTTSSPSTTTDKVATTTKSAPAETTTTTTVKTSSTTFVTITKPATTTTNKPAPTTEANYRDGKVTYYFQYGAYGACGKINPDSAYIAALSPSVYNGGANCGRKIRLVTASGNEVVATVADMCPGCDPNHVDLSSGAYDVLGHRDLGVIPVKWTFI